MPREEDWTVTPDMEAAQADRVLRAFYGYECVYRDGERKTELIGGKVVFGDPAKQRFSVRGGYITTERIRALT